MSTYDNKKIMNILWVLIVQNTYKKKLFFCYNDIYIYI